MILQLIFEDNGFKQKSFFQYNSSDAYSIEYSKNKLVHQSSSVEVASSAPISSHISVNVNNKKSIISLATSNHLQERLSIPSSEPSDLQKGLLKTNPAYNYDAKRKSQYDVSRSLGNRIKFKALFPNSKIVINTQLLVNEI